MYYTIYTRYADTSFVMFVSCCIFVSFRTFLFFLRLSRIVQCWFALIWIHSKTKSSTCATRTTTISDTLKIESFIHCIDILYTLNKKQKTKQTHIRKDRSWSCIIITTYIHTIHAIKFSFNFAIYILFTWSSLTLRC